MIRVAILGAGIGLKHLAGFALLPERFQVTTICDLDRARAMDLIGSSPIRYEPDFNAVLANPDIDLIDVCLPPHLHFSVCKAAMEAGKHVICEKPLVSSLREVDALIEVVERTGKLLSPVLQYRFGLAMEQIRALQAAGLIGVPYAASLETHWNRGADYYAIDWRGTWAGEYGGAVLGHAIHNHDLLTTVMGPIKKVSAMTTTRVNPIETEDCAAICFGMENGALATSSVTVGSATNISRLRFCFDGLTATSGTEPYAPMIDKWQFLARDPVTQTQVDEVLAGVQKPFSGFSGLFAALADHLDGKESAMVTAQDGRRSIELVAAIYQAARTGETVSLPLGVECPLYSGWSPAAKL